MAQQQFQGPVLVFNANMKRETGRKAQLGNITAGKAVAALVRTALGPKAMLKMLLSASGGIVITNDGNAILREIDVAHPAAKSLIELSRVQDEEVGDGTTSVIVLTGEMLYAAETCLVQRNLHPTEIIRAYQRGLEDILAHVNSIAWKVDLSNRTEMAKIIESCLGTKFTNRWSKLMVNLSLDAVAMVALEKDGRKEVDTKRYVRIEKLPGGEMEDSQVLRGVMFNKDVTHAKMRRRIEKPRILLLDCTLEYKKGESATSAEITKEGDFEELLRQEEEQIQRMCADILKFKPDLVITEKGMSDLCQHIFVKHNISGLRRLKKTDTNRIARACGATIVNRTDEIKESDIGTGAGLFEVVKIGDEYYSYITDCKDPKACTIVLRGASKDVLNEVERNLHDSLAVTRNVHFDPRLVTGGGAVEVSASVALTEKAKSITGKDAYPYEQMARALEVIPRTLTQNCGGNPVKIITELRAKYAGATPGSIASWGVDGHKGVVADLRAQGVWEPLAVKVQSIKTSIEAACMLLRVDDIVSGSKKKAGGGGGGAQAAPEEQQEMD